MRIVILIPKLHAGAELSLNKILAHRDLDIVGIVRSDISIFTKRFWNYIKYGISRSGIFYASLIGFMAYIHLFAIFIARVFSFRKNRKWLKIDELVEKYQIPIYDTQDINSEETIKILKNWDPDIVVSINFDQILKKEVICIAKQATLNVHPSILSKHRGVMPDFWSLLNEESTTGVTIHHLIEKLDAGDIIAEEQFPIKKHDNRFSLSIKYAQRGSRLLISTLKKLKSGIKFPKISLETKSKLYSLPEKEHFEKFHQKGKKLFSLNWIWRFFKRVS